MLSLQSCEDVINVNLKDISPRLVVQGSVNNLSDTIRVSLHKSTDYFTPSNIDPVTNAIVSVSSSDGNLYQLANVSNGVYVINNISALPGDIFTLHIALDGVNYTAVSKMPNLVKIDSAYITKNSDRFNENRININITDPAGVENFYRVRVFRNDTLLNSNRFALYSDKYFDGKSTTIDVNSRRFGIPRFKPNDKVRVQLISIEKVMYDFYQVLEDITDSGNILSASTPSNPPNNLDNGALGYFGAWSISEKTIVVK